MASPPRTQYVRSGDVHIAYQVTGDGPIDLVLAVGALTHLEAAWDEPLMAQYYERLSSFCRLIRFDQRGVGMSDPITSSTRLSGATGDLSGERPVRAPVCL